MMLRLLLVLQEAYNRRKLTHIYVDKHLPGVHRLPKFALKINLYIKNPLPITLENYILMHMFSENLRGGRVN